MVKGKSFVKWAGGKRQIISDIKKYIPKDFKNYYEPFVGGGAVFFELFNSYGKTAYLNDYNKEIINVYECLKDDIKFEKVCKELDHHEANHSEDYYYEIRGLDKDKKSFSKLSDYKRAARTIYLNKACFNGLYRVNRNNEFNVPFGKKSKVNTYDAQNLGIVHCILNFNNILLSSTDFEEALKGAKKGDFIYLDPPYDSDTTTFNDYTENGFGKEEQKRLANVFKKLDKKGCYVMLSNHNTKLVSELYKGFNKHIIKAHRNINANGEKRGKVEEVIISNYKNDKGE